MKVRLPVINYCIVLLSLPQLLCVNGKGCKNRRKVNNIAECTEPDSLLDTEWIHAIGRQGNSILFWDEFDRAYNSTLGTVIHDGHTENIVIGNGSKCPKDGKERKRKRNKKNKGKGFHDPLHKDTLIENALCEWITVENVDENRKPTSLIENKCGCRYTKFLGKNYLCENLEMYVSVLRRTGCADGTWLYKRTWEPHSVACIAVRLPSPQSVQKGRMKSSV